MNEVVSNQDRITGALFGVAVGDSIGLPAEGLSRKRIAAGNWAPWRQRMLFGRGMVSDDTEHTVLVAEAILASEGEIDVFEKSLATGLRRWFLAVPPGIGWATMRACLVANNNKKRFAFSEDGDRIRASQGHSVAVDLGLEPAVPPDFLFHGTVERFLGRIMAEGLKPGQRQHVHLSRDLETAVIVGNRRGKAVVLAVDAVAMVVAGHTFYLSANGVWLTDHVPPEFLQPVEGE